MEKQLSALSASVAGLATLIESLDPSDYSQPAYPAEWSIADVLSHVGSGAVIMDRRLADVVQDRPADPNFNQSIWDEWNAKSPEEQVRGAFVADRLFLDHLDATTAPQRARFQSAMGPVNLDFDAFVGLRLNEHALHTWDVAVTRDDDAVLSVGAADAMLDGLGLLVRFAGKPAGDSYELRLATTRPDRQFALSARTDSLSVAESDQPANADLELPGEALIRLVAGRLDPSHTPTAVRGPVLDRVRRSFPGY